MPSPPRDAEPATGHLHRPRLSQSLLRSPARIRLLWAPAGSGKSALLRECAQACPDDTRLCRFELHGQAPAIRPFLARLAAALDLDGAEPEQVLAGLAQRQAPIWLMLDDLPRRADAEFDALLNQLLLHASPQVHWWLASRRRSGLQLERLLLAGELHELNGAQLALTASELEQLLRQEGWPEPERKAAELLEQTAGWCAGVRLRLLTAQAPERGEHMLRNYLEQELLEDLEPGQCQALSTLACLPGSAAELCEQLAGVEPGAHCIRQLHDLGAFVEPLGSGFRIHPAVAQPLAGRLPEPHRRSLYRHASRHLAEQGELCGAIRYALRAEQPEAAASLLERLPLERLLQGRGLALLLDWRQRLPAEWLEGSPRLVILQGWALLLAGHLDELENCLALLPRSLPQPTARRQRELLAQGQLLAALLAHARGRGAQAVGEVAAQLPDWAWAQTGLAWLTLADAALAQGRIADAQSLNRRATGLARRHDCQALEGLLLLQHAEMLEMRGELGRADTLLQRLLQALPRDASADLLRGRARLRRARLLAHLGQREEAASLYRQGLRECTECADPWLAQGYLGLAELDAEAGDFPAAFSRLAELERELQQRRVDESCYRAQVGLLRGRLWLCQGQHARALHLAGQCLEQDAGGACPELPQRLWLLRARALSAAGQDLEAELEQRLHQALNEGRHGMGRELLFALAESHFARGRQRKAQGALLDGLALGRRMGMAGMEWHCRPSDPGLAGWAGKASAPCADSPSAALAQLSRRELSVLQMIAQGLRNQDIAEHLHLSLHTVKSHAQRINVKLGVSSRVQAVVRAKELSLIG